MIDASLSRRALLAGFGGLALAGGLTPRLPRAAQSQNILTRAIPGSEERLPLIGMGTWITFNVGNDEKLRRQRSEVLQRFFELGGGMIDSSPMYGSSPEVIGYGLRQIEDTSSLFAATKVWTPLQAMGEEQMAESRENWGLERFDLMQVHNLLNWEGHLETLRADKEAGRVRYIGITTSHGRRHAEMEKIMANEPLDFVQFTYNILDREAEDRLLPLAAERGIGVIANRPFQRKQLIRRFQDKPLPDWAGEIDCANWPQFLLKFIVSHPGVTCAIPATTRVEHMSENMGAMTGRLPDAALRQRMIRTIEEL